ncbi:Gfo/Idh/MocA family protein [Planctomicrobium sp. SH661]|uniref:Gfo/Idh/MocA family protein n=1 Tax=Planctomicrobium sp. SH661 TaxID=3448124 RepID=UPI003F5B47B2
MSSSPKIRVALIGCGQIADAHLSQLQRIKSAEVVAVCDMHEDLAWQAAARFAVPRHFTNHERMLEQTRPDVVHITTPAHTHAPLAKELLRAGCHVYVEKPFTLDAVDAREVLAVAEETGRFVCVGHDQLFDPAWLRCKAWINRGVIGEVRHIESVLGYPIDGKFGNLVAGNPNHWVRKLPGGLFQNTISHPLYRITDLMKDVQPALIGGWRTRPEFDFPTEMSISFQGQRQNGSLTFSTFLPPQRITRVYGSKGTIDVDFDAQTLRLNRLTRLPGAFGKLEAPWQQFGNSVWNLKNNLLRFACSDIHYFAGMKNLFEAFYQSIQTGSPLPIPPEEVERVTFLMDRIFDHCRETTARSNIPQTSASEASSRPEVQICP